MRALSLHASGGVAPPQASPAARSITARRLCNAGGLRTGPGRQAQRALLAAAKDAGDQPDGGDQPAALSSTDRETLSQFYASLAVRRAGGAGSAGSSAASGSPEDSQDGWAAVPVERVWASDPISGRQPEDLGGPAEPLAAAEEVLFSAAQLASDAASDASDVAEAVQQVAADMANDAASDAADVASALQQAAVEMANDAASDAADVASAVQQAAADVQQQVAADVAEAAQALADAASTAAGTSAAAYTSRPQGQLRAPEPPAGSLNAPKPPAGSLSAPKPPAGSLSAPEPPAGALPQQTSASAGASSSSGASTGAPGGTPSSSAPSGSGAAERADELRAVKQQLVGLLASLDRGAAATEDQAQRVENLARRLETLGGAVSLSWDKPASGAKPTMALLDGRWRLLYSSGFQSGSMGGRRPGPSFGSLPLALGQVFQDVYTDRSELDNTVDLFLRWSAASLPGVPAGVPTAHARLRHTYTIIGSNTVEITFEDTEVKLQGGLQGWLDSVPGFTLPRLPEMLQARRPPKGLRSARFDVVFLDEQMRVTRGDRGELRIFIKGEV